MTEARAPSSARNEARDSDGDARGKGALESPTLCEYRHTRSYCSAIRRQHAPVPAARAANDLAGAGCNWNSVARRSHARHVARAAHQRSSWALCFSASSHAPVFMLRGCGCLVFPSTQGGATAQVVQGAGRSQGRGAGTLSLRTSGWLPRSAKRGARCPSMSRITCARSPSTNFPIPTGSCVAPISTIPTDRPRIADIMSTNRSLQSDAHAARSSMKARRPTISDCA